MKRSLILSVSICLLSVLCVSTYAASDTATHDVTMNVNEVVLIDVNNTGTLTLNTTAPANGGEDVTGETDSTSKLLQYTSLVGAGTTRNISVSWSGDLDGACPAGTHLEAEAITVPGGCGSAVGGGVTVSAVDQNIITTIGSCATGTGASGAQMEYRFVVDTVSSLVVGDTTSVRLVFTLTDAS
ncbi:MAG: hypothetical protein JXJ04_02685 [Spirochaetales bacterium]|nr:hypothetical protein [Spirochaetales bacterium]